MLFWQKIPNMIEVYHQKVDITDIKKTQDTASIVIFMTVHPFVIRHFALSMKV